MADPFPFEVTLSTRTPMIDVADSVMEIREESLIDTILSPPSLDAGVMVIEVSSRSPSLA